MLHDLKEIGPTYFFAPPRIWENLLTNVHDPHRGRGVAEARRSCTFFLALAQDLERRRLPGQPLPLLAPPALSARRRLLVYGPLRDNLGLRRIRRAYTAGEAIGPEIFVFFRALGINVKQLYGMTEASVFVTIQKDGDVRLDTVGTPMPGGRDAASPGGARCCSGARACSRATTRTPRRPRQTHRGRLAALRGRRASSTARATSRSSTAPRT